jgi:hypothetical protein
MPTGFQPLIVRSFFGMALGFIAMGYTSRSVAQEVVCDGAPGFNQYMCESYKKLLRERANLGWSEAPAMTRNYPFGSEQHGEIRASVVKNPRPTTDISCNGAMLETLVVAMTLYAKANPAWSPASSIPLKEFNSQELTSLRGNIMMVEAKRMAPFSGKRLSGAQLVKASLTQSDSISAGFQKFGMADPITHPKDFAVGDVVTLDRDVSLLDEKGKVVQPDGSGHSGMFVGWLGADQSLLPVGKYDSSRAKGFVYFSSQTNYVRVGGELKKSVGLGLRAAYFKGFCPQDSGNRRDPGKKNCMDQRVQDEPDYRSNYVAYSEKFPKMTGDLKPDCCVVPSSLKVGRVRSIEKWDYATAAPRVAASCDTVARELVGVSCPRPK